MTVINYKYITVLKVRHNKDNYFVTLKCTFKRKYILNYYIHIIFTCTFDLEIIVNFKTERGYSECYFSVKIGGPQAYTIF